METILTSDSYARIRQTMKSVAGGSAPLIFPMDFLSRLMILIRNACQIRLRNVQRMNQKSKRKTHWTRVSGKKSSRRTKTSHSAFAGADDG